MSDEAERDAQAAPVPVVPVAETGTETEAAAPDGASSISAILPWLGLAGLGLLLPLTVFTLVWVISLNGDVGRLEEQGRRAAKAIKALEAENEELREALAARAAAPAAPKPAPPPVPRNIDAADPAHDCVIRPGSAKGGLGACL